MSSKPIKYTAGNMVQYVLQEFPQYQQYWENHLEYWKGDKRGLHIDIANFLDFTRDLLEVKNYALLPEIFQIVEDLVKYGDEEVNNAVSLSFLESLTNSSGHCPEELPYESYIPLLGPESKKVCKELDKFWGTRTPGLWEEDDNTKIIYQIKERIKELRRLFHKHKINGYIVPTTDEYLSEYPPACARRLEYITGFSGSYGMAIILENIILFFTDGRYLTGSREELDPEYFRIFDISGIHYFDWKNYIADGDIIAYDPGLFTERGLQNFNRLKLQPLLPNLIDEIWTGRPAKPDSEIYEYPVKYAGVSYEEKLARCRNFIAEAGGEALVITNSESICWLLNIRAHDAPFSPLLLANMIVTENEVFLFTDISRFEKTLLASRPYISILPEAAFPARIEEFSGIILFDANLCSSYIADLIKKKAYREIRDPVQLEKACKNKTEIEYMAKGHVEDAVAVCEFLAMIADTDISSSINRLSEYDLGIELTAQRAKRAGYVMDSFASICGYQSNGAIIHYRAEEKSAKKIAGSGLLLIDSGGQYLGATTDITRTVAIGRASDEHKYFYTKVLKGHIALASVIFPAKKVTGGNLDVLARQYLWQDGKDYAHGTGHGVGSFLSVHEGPQSISLSGNSARIEAGMVVSNEPGYYVPGKFGIRIENMMYAKESEVPGYLQFEMLTLVPYARDLIDPTLLTAEEIAYLRTYYRKIQEQIQPLLGNSAAFWLEKEISWAYTENL